MVPQKAHKDGIRWISPELSLTIVRLSILRAINSATSSRIVVNHYWDANGSAMAIMLKYFQFGEFPQEIGRTMMHFPYLLSNLALGLRSGW